MTPVEQIIWLDCFQIWPNWCGFLDTMYYGVWELNSFLLLAEVGLGALWIGLQRILAGLPASWADFTVLVDKLESLNESKGLVNWSANGQIVDCNLS